MHMALNSIFSHSSKRQPYIKYILAHKELYHAFLHINTTSDK